MKLTRDQKKLLRFVFKRFPTPFNGARNEVRPRSSVNPPTQKEIQTALCLQFKLLLDFVSAHQLMEKTYRHGAAEYSTAQIAPGTIIHMPIACASPPDADPSDERYGFFCYQITDRGTQELNRPGPVKMFATLLNEHYKGCVIPLLYTVLGAIAGGSIRVSRKALGANCINHRL